jgi:hypothetical protein
MVAESKPNEWRKPAQYKMIIVELSGTKNRNT